MTAVLAASSTFAGAAVFGALVVAAAAELLSG
jgi:hypothetical protein